MIIRNGASLGGTLQAELADGFVPAFGDSFEVLSFGSRSGTFAAVMGTGLSARYSPTNVTLLKGLFSGHTELHSIDLTERSADGFRLRLIAESGRNYRVQASEDLKLWDDLLNTNSLTGFIHLFDPAAATNQFRFYRAISP
jgi:hypothetical protein